jgi:hypothetical protein
MRPAGRGSVESTRRTAGERIMKNYTIGSRWVGTRLMVAGLTAALATSAAGVVRASDGDGRPRLVGAWTVQVTLRDCASNAPMGTFNSLVTFHDGGTISEDPASAAFAPGQRSSGHGQWTRTGLRTYQQRMIGLIAFDTAANLPGTPTFDPTARITPGFFTGWSVVTHTLQLVDADHAASAGTNQFYKADGTLYRSGCSTATATRFQ